ncbi:RNA polymerase II elongation factor ELL [Blastomyces parvus]|uniref:RNA polymerase II elongation factor ELL n=1 Tax=Blastomyces parvus TaxID=2060905 RepID=A0A2B7WYZ2_9EURO|nr:RNA polymerase II elongation factor ELL [Blastomyces parvus]
MASLVIPEGGLCLRRVDPPGDSSSPDPASKPCQIMRLNLAQTTLDELVQSLRNDQKARIRLGKHQSLHYGNKSQTFYSSPESHRSEIYSYSPSSTTGDNNAYFTGVLSHKLEVEKAREATAATDEALANLEQRLSAFEKGKESRKTPMITTIDQMRALGAGDNRSATGKEAASLARMPRSKIDVEKERFFQHAAHRSNSASPGLLGARSPAAATSISTPKSASLPQNKDKIRLEALRVPLTHLLAVRPVSVRFLAQKTRSSQEDCLALVQKYGVENRLNREKYGLKDKAYKDLDIWEFPYPSEDERQEAIENAISAFDRMRISRTDKLWQMLLPKAERGKGKVLSRLNLHTGPIPKSATSRVNAQSSEDVSKEGYGTGNESERTAGGITPNRPNGNVSVRSGSTAQKKDPANKNGHAKRAGTRAKNTTLTGRVTKKTDKKTEKKSSAKPDTKYKSAEFVHDSDEDTEMADSPPLGPSTAATGDTVDKQSQETRASKTSAKSFPPSTSTTPKPAEAEKLGKAKTQSMKTIPSATATTRTASNSSPQKPSPLGSSPPTNASELESGRRSSSTTQSSSSSSPLMVQHSKTKAASTVSSIQTPSAVNGDQKPAPTSLKRKAETDQPPSRHANHELNGIRHSKPRPHPLPTPTTNGRIIEPKRRRLSSPSSGSTTGSTTGSASPPRSLEILRQRLRDKALQFKRYYASYRLLHQEMTSHPDPPPNEIEKLARQHERLQRMKQEIWEEDRRLRMG